MTITVTPAVVAQEIKLDHIKVSKTNPRRSVDEKASTELAESVRTHGVLQPVLVRPIEGKPDAFELVAGERRYRASRAAGNETIPATIRQLSDVEALEIQVIENLQRQDIHPMDEALGYQALIKKDAETYTVEGIAATVGKEPRYIAYRLNLLKLTENVRKAFYENKLSVAHAIEIARLQTAEQEQALEECFPNHKNTAAVLKDGKAEAECSVRRLRQWIQQHFYLDLSKAPFDPKDANLVPAAGACVSCPKRAGNNPLLFAEVAKKDTCTDAGCFQSKRDAFVEIRITGMETEGKKPVRVSESNLYGGEKKQSNVLYYGDYRRSTKDGCKDTQDGIVMDGVNIGKTVHVCSDEKCSTHNGRTSFSTPEQRTERKKQIKAQKVQKAYRRKLLEAVRAKLPSVINHEDLQMVASGYFDRIGHDNQRRIFAVYGWEETKTKGAHGYYIGHDKVAAQKIQTMSVSELGKFLIVCSLSSDLYIAGFNPSQQLGNDSLLVKTAKRYKVNPTNVLTEAKAELEKKLDSKKANAKATASAKVTTKRK